MAEWLKATDCKSVLSEYEGSNPSPSTSTSRGWLYQTEPVGADLMDDRVVTLLEAGVAQLVEHLPSKQDVASSSLVARSRIGF